MSRQRSFAGALAPLLFDSLSPKSFFAGSMVLASMAGLALLSRSIGVPQIAATLCMAAGSLAVVRIAINSAYGQEFGGLFETSGGSWGEVFRATGRMVILNLVWAIPVGIAFAGLAQGLGGLPLGGPLLLLLFGPAILPPLALILSLGVDSLGAAVSPAAWRALFAGRTDDLVTMLALSIGGFLASFSCAVILALGLGQSSFQFGLFVLLVGGAWSLGVTLHLVGRLAGGFLRTARDGETRAAEPGPVPSRPIDFDPTPYGATEDSGAVSPFGALGASATPITSMGSMASAPRAFDEGRFAAVSATAVADIEVAPDASELESVLGRLRANHRIEEDDRDLALEDAEHLVGKFGPHPQVLARVAALKHRLGHDDALDAARKAVGAARVVNNAGVLADLYEEFRSELDGVELSDIERQRMAASLATRGHFDAGLDLYDAILAENPHCLPVVKAMIKLAEEGLRTDEGAERALRIYDVIESRWTDHPFLDFVDRGREEVRRKLDRALH